MQPGFRRSGRATRRLATRVGSGILALGLSLGIALPTPAADPFRATSNHSIGDLTEDAFEAIFKYGDYVSAQDYLQQAESAESSEPLVHAMLASMAYLEQDWTAVKNRADLTKSTAEALVFEDPLRGHLYTAVGIFLQGAHLLKTQGVARGTPQALAMLQQVFGELDKAESIDATDPELNLLKGYMDLMLAVNLPFSNPEEAIARMNQHGSPDYLSQRGIAIGYRDLGQYPEAVSAVDRAIAAAPENPELYYLKGQLLARQGAQGDSVVMFNKALEYSAQLPPAIVRRIIFEGCVAEGASDVICMARRDDYAGG